jgi:hypothetical protein
MTALETAIAIPLIFWLVFSLLLSSPILYGNAEALAREAVRTTESGATARPDGWMRTGMALGDSAALLSDWIPGLGDLLSGLGGPREGR